MADNGVAKAKEKTSDGSVGQKRRKRKKKPAVTASNTTKVPPTGAIDTFAMPVAPPKARSTVGHAFSSTPRKLDAKEYGNSKPCSGPEEHFRRTSLAVSMARERSKSAEEKATRNLVKGFEQTLHEIPKDCFKELSEEEHAYNLDFSANNFRLRSLRGINTLPQDKLQHLDVSGNRLKMLRLGKVYGSLEVIRAPYNTISDLRLACAKLRVLDLQTNKLDAIPDLSGVPNLETLNLSHNKLEGGFGELAAVPRLKDLDISRNRFAFATRDDFEHELATLGSLVSLRELSISQNPFEQNVPNYRDVVLDVCVRLQLMDGRSVDVSTINRAMKRLDRVRIGELLTPRETEISELDFAKIDRAKVDAAMADLNRTLETARSEAAAQRPDDDEAPPPPPHAVGGGQVNSGKSAKYAKGMKNLGKGGNGTNDLLKRIMSPAVNKQQQERPAMITAAFLGHATVLRATCQADPEATKIHDADGRTAVMWAALQGNVECVKLLADEFKADVNQRDGTKKTALMWAAARGQAPCVEALLQAGASVDIRDKKGRTALVHAATAGCSTSTGESAAKCIHALLRAGASPSIQTKRGKTALDLATDQEVRRALGGSSALSRLGVAESGGSSKTSEVGDEKGGDGGAQDDIANARARIASRQRDLAGGGLDDGDRRRFQDFLAGLSSDSSSEAMKEMLVKKALPGGLRFSSVQAMLILTHFSTPQAKSNVARHIQPCLTDPHNFNQLMREVEGDEGGAGRVGGEAGTSRRKKNPAAEATEELDEIFSNVRRGMKAEGDSVPVEAKVPSDGRADARRRRRGGGNVKGAGEAAEGGGRRETADAKKKKKKKKRATVKPPVEGLAGHKTDSRTKLIVASSAADGSNRSGGGSNVQL